MLAVPVLALGPAASASAQTAPAAASSFVRVAHLSPDTEGVDVYVDGVLALQNVGFDTVSDYSSMPAGPHSLELRPTAAPAYSPPILDTEATLEPGAYYTVAGAGLRERLAGQIYVDDLTPPGAGVAKVRAIHAAVDAPAVDVVISGGDTLFSSTSFPAATPYKEVAPGTYDLELRETAGGKVLLEAPSIELSAGIVYTVAAIGGAGQPLRLLPVVDGRGTAVAPVGAVATGAGGTADRSSGAGGQGSEPALAATAVAATMAAGMFWRRRRSAVAA